ncbi:MAG: fatty acid desaturase [Granulosicoccaceae bacterium]
MKATAPSRSRARELVGDAMPHLSKRCDGPGLLYFTGHLLATGSSATLLWLSGETVLWPLALLLHGTVLVHWFAPFHEAAHFTVFRSRQHNRLLGWFSGFIVWLPFDYFVLEHRQHHLFTNLPEQDSEFIPHSKSRVGWFLYCSAIPYFISLFSTFLRYPAGRFNELERHFLGERGMRAARREVSLMLLAYALVIALAWCLGALALLWWYWILPRMIAEPLMRVIRLSEHGGCAEVEDMLRNTRTVMAMPVMRQLNWNMCFHAEHHALASVPFHRLPHVHLILKPHLEELCSSYLQASRETLSRAQS